MGGTSSTTLKFNVVPRIKDELHFFCYLGLSRKICAETSFIAVVNLAFRL